MRGRRARQRALKRHKAMLTTLQGLKVVVDVQHLYRAHKPHDRGTVYTLPSGITTTEAGAAFLYGMALKSWLEARGAQVLTNDPLHGILVGHYSTRNRAGSAWHAHAYLACHLNAGGGDYALLEYMSLTEAKALADAIGLALSQAFPVLANHRSQALSSTDRGAVCIERVESPAVAVLCEPFFGDRPEHQPLLAAGELKRVGEVIGLGVERWWYGGA